MLSIISQITWQLKREKFTNIIEISYSHITKSDKYRIRETSLFKNSEIKKLARVGERMSYFARDQETKQTEARGKP